VAIRDAIRSMAVGIWRTLRRMLSALGVIAAIAVLGLVLSLPLWAFASYEPQAFTLVALTVLAVGLVFLLVRRVVRRAREAGGTLAWLKSRVNPALRGIGVTVAFLAAAYLVVLLLARGLIAVAVVAAAAAVLVGAYFRFARGRRD
jgi:hypothetical protein